MSSDFPQAVPWFGRDRKPPQFYRGLRVRADTNLHQQLQRLITELVPPAACAGRRPSMLDLGCGEGALAQRLSDLRYDVLAVDRDEGQFKAKGPEFVVLDLNDRAAVEQFVAQHQGGLYAERGHLKVGAAHGRRLHLDHDPSRFRPGPREVFDLELLFPLPNECFHSSSRPVFGARYRGAGAVLPSR